MDTRPEMQFYQQVFGGSWMTQGLSVAAELGVADLLAEGPRDAAELAAATGADAGALYRLLRALAGAGVFGTDDAGRFSLTPVSELLRGDVAGSQRAFAIMMGSEFHGAWGELAYSVRTGKPGFDRRFGKPFFEYMSEHPQRHALYDAAMNGIHDPETGPMLDAYDFGAFRSMVDVGGGNGLTLATILRRHAKLQGTLLEMPGVAERAREVVSGFGLDGRCRIEAGDFFAAVPAGADAYLLRHIVHDWQDPEAATILRRCGEAAAPGGRVLVVETVIPPDGAPSFGKWLDLMMLLVAGRERTEAEFRRLFESAGLRLNRVVPTAAGVSVIEGVR